MSSIERKAADAAPGSKAYARATVTSAERLTIPSEMLGKFCFFAAQGVDVFVRFGGASVSVSATATATVSSEALTEDATSPHLYIPAGTMIERRLPSSSTYTKMVHISAATTGYFRFGLSEGAHGSD